MHRQSRPASNGSAGRRADSVGGPCQRPSRSSSRSITLAAAYIHGHSVGRDEPVVGRGHGRRRADRRTRHDVQPRDHRRHGTLLRPRTAPTWSTSCGCLDVAPRDERDGPSCRRSGTRVRERFSVDEVVGAYEALLMSAAAGSSRRRFHHVDPLVTAVRRSRPACADRPSCSASACARKPQPPTYRGRDVTVVRAGRPRDLSSKAWR